LGWKTGSPEPISSGKLYRSRFATELAGGSRRSASSIRWRWLVEGFLGLPRGAVDPLELLVLLVAAPVRRWRIASA